MVFFYLGPDATMPLLSSLAAIIGIVLMFWDRTVGALQRRFRRGGRPAPVEAEQPQPKMDEVR